jgi:signal transduction histidine kinase
MAVYMQQTPTPPTDDDGSGGDDYYTSMAAPSMSPLTLTLNTNWARTALGPLRDWSPTLRLFTRFMLADARPACLWWGPDFIAIYNEAYMPLAAQMHPALMGSTFIQGYPDLWPQIGPYFAKCRRTGSGVSYSSATPTLVERKGWTEETFFSGSFTPIGPAPHSEGIYNSAYEVTSQKLADRRTSMLNSLAAVPSQTVDAVFAHIVTTLETNPFDIPLAMLYKYVDGAGPHALQLQGHIGLSKGHNLIVEKASMDSELGLVPDMRRAGSEATTIDYDERFNSASWRGWGSPSKRIAILPITSDDLCQQFMRDLNRMVSSIVASAVDSESAKRRQEQLEADLAFSDLKLRHLIDHASVGMCHVSIDGRTLWANEHYYRLSGKGAEHHVAPLSFYDVYLEADWPKVTEVWESLLAGVDQVTAEVRLKRMYEAPIGDPEPAQIQILAFPYRDPETGQVTSVMACTTDISRLKWAQTFQARLAAEAKEAKRQQEAFIDVVSHEMRNPLSAIVHCADAIASTLDDVNAANLPAAAVEALNENAQSADVILQCANHQKRIIDDILTLSKLDSMLLSITPVAVQPRKLIDSIVSIFEPELKSKGIDYSVNSGSSITDLGIDYVYLDPSRVTQVFINLLTNAIKFVKPSKEPAISIRFGASLVTPKAFFPDTMFWAIDSKQDEDVTSSPEWGAGQEMYLTFTVRDSGIGLDNKEIHKIFERFRQANVKTHVQYGGSGLGLFISKELTEKQGGEIGVSSVLGQGSTFGFYVKTRRVEQQPQVSRGLTIRGSKQEAADQKLRVLLVEDNIINQQVLGKQLKKAGCMVNVANHGLEALDALEQQTFDVCLMDLEMPVSFYSRLAFDRVTYMSC